MLIRRVHMRSFRGVADRELRFTEGINLVYGPNESGKSTLVQALRFGLFESFKGQAEYKQRLQSWYDEGPPQVTLELELDGVTYVVEKRFLKRAGAKLVGGGRTWTDEEAEEQLHRLLGATPPDGRGGRRGGRDDAELGLWPLLCVPQGSAGDAPHSHLHERTRESLRGRLAAEVGEVVAGPQGLALLEAAREERSRYFTERSATATGELREAESRVAAAKQQRDGAVAKRASMRDAADREAASAAKVADLTRRLQALEMQRAEAARRADALGRLDAEARELDEKVARLRAKHDRVRERVDERAAAARELERLAAQIGEVRATLAAAEAARRRADDELRSVAEEARRAEVGLESAQRRLRAAQERAQREGLEAERAALADRLREASRVRDARVEADAGLRALRVDGPSLRALREAERARATSRARLEALAVRVSIRALAPLEVQGQRLGVGERHEWSCTERTRFELPGAEVEIAPGGDDLDERAAVLRDAERTLAAKLAEAGVRDLAEAELAHERKGRLESERRALEAELRRLAPDGVDALRAALLRLEQRCAAAAAATVSADEAPPHGVEAAPAEQTSGGALDVEGARAAEDRARAALADARGRLDAARSVASRGREHEQKTALTEREHSGKLQQIEARLASLASAEALAHEEDAARAELQRAEAERARVDRERAELGGVGAHDEIERLDRSIANLGRERDEALQARTRAETELRMHEADDLHEAVQRAEAEYEEAEAHARRVRARAEAARRLLAVLEAARSELQQRLAEPVQRKVRPYLTDLFGAAELQLGEDWTVEGLRSGDVEQRFDELSGGAREQLGILVRLALAEVLSGGGRLPVVLDDALVNTDRARQEGMLRVLRRAGRTLQVIVLTCHEHAFDSLGESTRVALEPLRGSRRGADVR